MEKKNLAQAMKKTSVKVSHLFMVGFTMSELEQAYVACSNYNSAKSRVQTRTVNKIREALLNAVLKKARV